MGWLETYSKPRIRKSTYSIYFHVIKGQIEPAFPKVLLRNVTCDMLQKFYNEEISNGRKLGSGNLSASYVEKMMMIISNALKRAVTNGMISTNEATKVVLSRKAKN